MAWLEGGDAYHSQTLHVMDFDTAQKQDVAAPEGDYVRALGFVGSDLIYGFGHESRSVDGKWKRKGVSYVCHVYC